MAIISGLGMGSRVAILYSSRNSFWLCLIVGIGFLVRRVAILYSSRNSFWLSNWWWLHIACFVCRNPLFIKEFFLTRARGESGEYEAPIVAILYSSRNSFWRCSLIERMREDDLDQVAILYSSRNSFWRSQTHRHGPRLSLRRNPLFIKEFFLTMERMNSSLAAKWQKKSQSFIHQGILSDIGERQPYRTARDIIVAILYSSRNSFWRAWDIQWWVNRPRLHFVAILYSSRNSFWRDVFVIDWHAQLMLSSQSFIHQGILSDIDDCPARWSCPGEVAILYSSRNSFWPIKGSMGNPVASSRNPLFIKEFFLTMAEVGKRDHVWAAGGRNPLFIKEFFLTKGIHAARRCPRALSQSFIHQGILSDPAPLQPFCCNGLPDHFL
jgi:hypothetical protein